jgi:hypothetical protein
VCEDWILIAEEMRIRMVHAAEEMFHFLYPFCQGPKVHLVVCWSFILLPVPAAAGTSLSCIFQIFIGFIFIKNKRRKARELT